MGAVCFLGGLFVDFRRTSCGQSIVERERGSLNKRVVLLWVCSVPSLPVWLPVHGVHYMSTSGYSSHTPEIELIKWAWLNILHTTDVFGVGFFWFNSMLQPTHIEG